MDIKEKLSKIDKDHYQLLVDIGKVSQEIGQKSYLVGGMVRDLLLGFDNLDIDIVVESNASMLANALTEKIQGCELSAKHDKFHTAKLIFTTCGKKIPVDLASTREEIYEYSAALPKVSISDLKKDLYRRDFTINALAVSLMPSDFGEVVDLFNGLIDLKNKQIRVLHDLSFTDDPTRMIRAVRFTAKLNFEIEEHTNNLFKKAINSKQFDNLIEKIRGDRVKIEIRYLFNLPNIEEAIKVFFDSGVYRMVSTELKPCRDMPRHVSTGTPQQWLIILACVLKDLPPEKQDQIMKNLQMSGDEIKIIKNGFNAFNNLKTLQEKNENIDSVVVYQELKNLSIESVAIVKLLFTTPTINDLINEYIEKTSKIKLEITGDDIKALGIKEGERIGEILEKVLEKKILNPNMRKEDELKEVRRLLQIVIDS